MDKATLQKLLAEYPIQEALQEVQEKSEEQIEAETATKWAARAMGCFLLFHNSKQLRWLLQAELMYHEAIEHAAAVKDDGKTVTKILTAMDALRPKEE
jgi:hypothetical protein